VDQYGLGIRTPGLVISPYARQNFVDHKTYSFESWLKIVEERFQVNSMTARDNMAIDMIDGFDFTQAPRAPVLLAPTTAGSPYPPAQQTISKPANLLTVLSGEGGYTLAPGAIASAFGMNLASGNAGAQPPSTSVGGVSVTVTDGHGNSASAPIYYVSPTQVNFVVPASLAGGAATVTVSNGAQVASGAVSLYAVAPVIYTADQSGSGFAAGYTVSGSNYSFVAECTINFIPCDGYLRPTPIDLSGGPVYLSLFGTGIRSGSNVTVTIGNENGTVLYAGAQSQYPGLDQVNVQIPADLRGRGRLSVVVTVNGQISNPVWIAVA
jgi:uncharacterized protein (TIGR03437 family)